MKVGDLVRFKMTAMPRNHTEWLKGCARDKVPMLILKEYSSNDECWDGNIEAELLGERIFEVMCEEVSFHAFESELTKRGF
jgi:hypothetical protein|tara:strand:- start:746 stop:988 length:243 start_codon:yes stop_codon:yes gene_type:complete